MNEFIELEILTESGVIYNAGEYIEKLINGDFYSYTSNELKRIIKELNNEFTGNTEIEIYNCNQIKKIYNYMRTYNLSNWICWQNILLYFTRTIQEITRSFVKYEKIKPWLSRFFIIVKNETLTIRALQLHSG